ncbi:DNA translocase FtsK [Indiicoccus explosivorum]|uniref:DNA translocase FtsK n=1 Tax=Indiicoccus explosivorum TaxID=1917864 RepID=UPI0011866E20|nr:DNA translocase FtsK [Indiicoccus explosivorum]
MNWMKGLWSKLFAEAEESERRETEQAEFTSKPPFRFPLISDEEAMGNYTPSYDQEPDWIDWQPVSKEPAAQAEPHQEPETGLEWPVKARQPRTVHTTTIYDFPAAPAERKKPVPNPRYKPSRVPSPVHGFQKHKVQDPAPIRDLLEEHEQTKEIGSPSPDKPDKLVLTESREIDGKGAETAPAAELSRKEVHMEAPVLADRVKEDIPDEASAGEKDVSPVPADAQEKQNPRPAERGKTAPFNVIMLKSDKEKLKKCTIPPVMTETTPTAEIKPAQLQSGNRSYEFPPKILLRKPEENQRDEQWLSDQGDRLIEALSHFQVKAEIMDIMQGPAVTQFELKVANGVKVSKIRNLADDLKLALAAKDIRIQAPIPGKSSIGIEIPNRVSRPVRISEIIGSPSFDSAVSPLEAALGLDLTGRPVTLDLRKMPHGLIAGATGSGKSVCINSLLVSLLYKASPEDLKLLLIDPKMVELAPYNNIPHLVSPVITDVKAATASLKWAVGEMERRYQLFAHTGVRDIARYNRLVEEKGNYVQRLPYMLIVIDELADLMMMAPADVEDAICRIAQKARACGIHLIVATQRPSVDVITGLIKANVPARIAFSVSSQVDSRTILDTQGAERLLGRGDMLYLGHGMSAPVRLQGTFVTDEEIEEVIAHARQQGQPDYLFKEDELISPQGSPDQHDDLFEEACRFILSQGSASTSLLQRKFHIGYNRAARLMDLIEQHGFVSEPNGSKARDVLLTEEELEEIF